MIYWLRAPAHFKMKRNKKKKQKEKETFNCYPFRARPSTSSTFLPWP